MYCFEDFSPFTKKQVCIVNFVFGIKLFQSSVKNDDSSKLKAPVFHSNGKQDLCRCKMPVLFKFPLRVSMQEVLFFVLR